MRTKNYQDIDRAIAEQETDLYSCEATELEKHLSKLVLKRLNAERDEALAEWRASPDWDQPPF